MIDAGRAIWIFKCNSKPREYAHAYGDWADVFASTKAQGWGTTEFIPKLRQAETSDTILAYQTDRNELVGIARVVRWDREGKYDRLVLLPVRTIGVRVRRLKQEFPNVARIPAFKPGPIQTLYAISRSDALVLLKAADAHLARATGEISNGKGRRNGQGAGFGSFEQNKQVEKAAMRAVARHYKDKGWKVRDISSENRGYDLLCRGGPRAESHVEVKGARGDGQQFIISANELSAWSKDKQFVLAFVANALSKNPAIWFFPGIPSLREFSFRALSYIAKRQPNLTPKLYLRKGRKRRKG